MVCYDFSVMATIGRRTTFLSVGSQDLKAGSLKPTSFFCPMKLSQSLSPVLEYRLQMLHLKPKHTVLVMGCLQEEESVPPQGYSDFISYFEKKAETLRSQGGFNFVFIYWNTFEQAFLQALLNTRKKADRYMLIGEGINPAILPPDHHFEEILLADDLYCEDEKDLYDNLLFHCNMVATYRIKDIIPHESIAQRAVMYRKFVIRMDEPEPFCNSLP